MDKREETGNDEERRGEEKTDKKVQKDWERS